MYTLYRKLKVLKGYLKRLNRDEFNDQVKQARFDLELLQQEMLAGVPSSNLGG